MAKKGVLVLFWAIFFRLAENVFCEKRRGNKWCNLICNQMKRVLAQIAAKSNDEMSRMGKKADFGPFLTLFGPNISIKRGGSPHLFPSTTWSLVLQPWT